MSDSSISLQISLSNEGHCVAAFYAVCYLGRHRKSFDGVNILDNKLKCISASSFDCPACDRVSVSWVANQVVVVPGRCRLGSYFVISWTFSFERTLDCLILSSSYLQCSRLKIISITWNNVGSNVFTVNYIVSIVCSCL